MYNKKKPMSQDKKTADMAEATRIIKCYEQNDSDRSLWKTQWNNLTKFGIPRKDDVYGGSPDGTEQGQELFDTEAIRAGDELVAALYSSLCNPALIWLFYEVLNPSIRYLKDVLDWNYKVSIRLLELLEQSNFYVEITEAFLDAVQLGTCVLRTDSAKEYDEEGEEVEDDTEGESEIFCFESEPIYTVVIDVDSKKRVRKVIRKFQYTCHQLCQEYGDLEHIDEKIRKTIMADENKKWTVFQEVCKRPIKERMGEIGAKAMPYKSTHVLQEGSIILKRGGFEEFNFGVGRWSVVNKEKYGRGPLMKALADVRLANKTKEVWMQSNQLAMAPPQQVSFQGFLAPLKLHPWAINYKRSPMDKAEKIDMGANPNIGLDMMQELRAIIRAAYMLDKLQLPNIDRMTTTEVIQRRDENLRVLGPNANRIYREILKPTLNRAFGIAYRSGQLPEAPDAVKQVIEKEGGLRFGFRFASTVAQAQSALKVENVIRAVASVQPVAQYQPEIMDNIDGDKVLTNSFTVFNADPSLLRDENKVKKIREARQASLDQQMQMERTKHDTEAASKMGALDVKANVGK